MCSETRCGDGRTRTCTLPLLMSAYLLEIQQFMEGHLANSGKKSPWSDIVGHDQVQV